MKILKFICKLYISMTKQTVFLLAIIGTLYVVMYVNYSLVQYLLVLHCYTLAYFSILNIFSLEDFKKDIKDKIKGGHLK